MQPILADDVRLPFTPERFALRRAPEHVGAITTPFSVLPSALDMLIKLPGGPVCVPAPYQACPTIQAILDQALAFEDRLLPTWRDTHYLYLTLDQRPVRANHTHRNAGWHFDGFQGARYPEKLPACHQYLCCDALPTQFSTKPVDASGLHETRDNWFEALGAQACLDPSATPAPGDIVVMSAYQLHQSPRAQQDTTRTFLRLDVSRKQQDRLGNTPNPDLPAPWTYQPRDLPQGLGRPINDTGWA